MEGKLTGIVLSRSKLSVNVHSVEMFPLFVKHKVKMSSLQKQEIFTMWNGQYYELPRLMQMNLLRAGEASF